MILTTCASAMSHKKEIEVGQPRRPNILFIMSDDHASQAVSCYNGFLAKVLPTPNIDRLAREGVRLDNCFVTNSICTPSRAAILTGKYSHKNGVYTLDDTFDSAQANVARQLQKAGYLTAVIGKWHLGTEPRGFDYFDVLTGQGRYYNPLLKRKGNPWSRANDAGTEHKGYSTDVVTDLALDWLAQQKSDRPFFLMCQYKAPHRAWDPAPRFKKLFAGQEIPEPANLYDDYAHRSNAARNAALMIGRDMNKGDLKQEIPSGLKGIDRLRWSYQVYIKDYLRCVAAVDENIGRLLTYLDNHQLTQDTVVIYTSDQGFFLGEHGYYDKRFMYEESLRMPFVIRYPREIPAKQVNRDMVTNVDFASLFLDYAGQAIPGDMQGRSFRANLKGNTPTDWRQAMYYRYWMHQTHHGVPGHYGIRTQDHKLIFFYGHGLDMKGTDRPNTERINFSPTTPEWELFDLKKDPAEMNNVYHDPAYAQVVKQLKAQLLDLKKDLGDTDDQYPEMFERVKKYWD